MTGVAVARTLRAVTSLDVRLKWPNDLLLGGSKLGGLLIESRSSGGDGCTAIGGIGINLIAADGRGAGAPGNVARVATLGSDGSGGAVPIARDALAAAVAAGVLDAWARFDEGGWMAFDGQWRSLDALAGRGVRVHEGAPPVSGAPDGDGPHFDGVARGIDAGGALLVERDDGRTVAVHAGDVSVRPRP